MLGVKNLQGKTMSLILVKAHCCKLEMQLQVSSEIGTGFVNTSLGITKLAWNSKEHPRDFYYQQQVYKALYTLQCRERV